MSNKQSLGLAQRQKRQGRPPFYLLLVIIVISVVTTIATNRCDALSFIMVAPLFSVLKNFIDIPRSLWNVVITREHYSRLSKELPFILSLALITSSSGLTIDHIFIGSLQYSETKAFSVESRKYLLLRLMGRAWDSCLEELEKGSPSSIYKSFVRGLRNVASTSLRLPEYISSFFETYFIQLEALWRDYWARVSALLEAILLMVLSFITIYVSWLLLEGLVYRPLLYVFIALILLAGLLGVVLLRSLRPADNLVVKDRRRVTLIIIAPWLISLFVTILNIGIVVKTLIVGVVLTFGGLIAELWRRKALLIEEELLLKLQRLEELVKSGYDVHFALKESGLTSARHDKSSLFETFAERLVKFVSMNTERYGVIREDFASKMYTYLKRLLDVNNASKSIIHAFMAIGFALPPLLAVLSLRFAGSLIAMNQALGDLGYLFLSTAISVGLLLSEVIDGFFALSLKPGIACLLLALALILF